MSKNFLNAITPRARIYLALTALAGLAIYFCVVFILQNDFGKKFSYNQIKAYPYPEFTVDDLSNPSALKVQLEWKRKTITMVYDRGVLKLPASYLEEGPVLPPYKLTISEQTNSGQYHDISLTVGDQGKYIGAILDGFSPQNTASLTLGNHAVFNMVSFDWSGRIDLNTIISTDVPMPACVQIFDNKASLFKICHAFPNGWIT